MIKFPKTPRVTSEVPEEWMKYQVLVEEKVDGANSAVSFVDGKLTLQSRGHILTGGPREQLFERMWPWAYERKDRLERLLGDRFILFGEWAYAKNKIFYDNLPDYFLAFDMYDKKDECFLSSPMWRSFIPKGIACTSVLWVGRYDKAPAFSTLIGPSNYKTDKWRKRFKKAMHKLGKHYDSSETEDSDLMEGVYIKVEHKGQTVGRMKLPRPEYKKVQTDDYKWNRRPLFPNELAHRR